MRQVRQEAWDVPQGLKVLDGTTLKLIAMATMVIDHVGGLFFPQAYWMRVIGRLAMPIFAFCVAEGYAHTRDIRRYMLRMLVFALISELPYDLFQAQGIDLGQQNIMFTFFAALMGVALYDWIRERYAGLQGFLLGCLAVVAIGLLTILVRFEYNITVVGLVFVFYVLRNQSTFARNVGAVAFQALVRNVGIYRWGILSFFVLILYNGKRGRGLKLLFYLFYPIHMLVLYLLHLLIG